MLVLIQVGVASLRRDKHTPLPELTDKQELANKRIKSKKKELKTNKTITQDASSALGVRVLRCTACKISHITEARHWSPLWVVFFIFCFSYFVPSFRYLLTLLLLPLYPPLLPFLPTFTPIYPPLTLFHSAMYLCYNREQEKQSPFSTSKKLFKQARKHIAF